MTLFYFTLHCCCYFSVTLLFYVRDDLIIYAMRGGNLISIKCCSYLRCSCLRLLDTNRMEMSRNSVCLYVIVLYCKKEKERKTGYHFSFSYLLLSFSSYNIHFWHENLLYQHKINNCVRWKENNKFIKNIKISKWRAFFIFLFFGLVLYMLFMSIKYMFFASYNQLWQI